MKRKKLMKEQNGALVHHHLVVSAFGNILAFAIVKLDSAYGIEV
jgi:hypothetical protein